MKIFLLLFSVFILSSCVREQPSGETLALKEMEAIRIADSIAAIDSAATIEENQKIPEKKITLKKDVIIRNEKKIIHGHTYYIRRYDDEGWRTGFKIILYKDGDSSIVYDGDDSYRGGNCNITSVLVTSHEIKRDTLLIDYYDEVKEHMDETNPHYSSSTKRETYAIQNKGPIVRLKTEYGKNDSLLDATIRTKLGDLLDECYNKY
jgi:hypothetical protein